MMRAIVVSSLGDPDVLRITEVPRPEPGPGQVLVRLHRTGVNFSDTERRRGVYANLKLPWMPGAEGAGVVEAVGEGADPALRGQRVSFWAMPPAVSGTYAEYAVTPESSLFLLGDRIGFDEGAALPLQGLTAYGVVHFAAQVREGQTVLIHAAGGGVGLIAVQLARLAGARVLGTVSSDEKAAAVQAVGGETLFYGGDLPQRVLAATQGRGVDVVLDSIGRDTQEASLACLAPYGHLVHYGEASGPAQPVDLEWLYYRCLKVSAFGLYLDDEEALAAARRDLLRRLEEGALRLTVSRVLPLEDAAEAHRLLESRRAVGKILLSP
jgi:NADPH2:quinone reductase